MLKGGASVACVAAVVVACGQTKREPAPTVEPATGGSPASADGSRAGSDRVATAGAEGSIPSGGATAGTSAGGVAGDGAGASTGGGEPGAIACLPVTTALITDFTYVDDPEGVTFGDFATTFSGSTDYYPDSLTSDVTSNAWHLSGTLDRYAGFGLNYAGTCTKLDASGYRGIAFTLSGTVPEDRPLTLTLFTAANMISATYELEAGVLGATPNFGRCIPETDLYDDTCRPPEAIVPVPGTPTHIELLWEAFTGGSPDDSVTASELAWISWRFSWTGADDTPYDVDVVIDDLAFVP